MTVSQFHDQKESVLLVEMYFGSKEMSAKDEDDDSAAIEWENLQVSADSLNIYNRVCAKY